MRKPGQGDLVYVTKRDQYNMEWSYIAMIMECFDAYARSRVYLSSPGSAQVMTATRMDSYATYDEVKKIA